MFPGKQSSFNHAAGKPLSMEYDVGLRSYMLKVMTLMCFGLAFTGALAAYIASDVALMNKLLAPPMGTILMIAPLGVAFFLYLRFNKMSVGTAKALFWGYAALIAVSTAPLFAAYAGASIAKVFFLTAGGFAALAFYGYTTKKDLTGFGSFLIMGVFGLIGLSIASIFFPSSMLIFAIHALGLLIFAGLTAYDMQNIKQSYYMHGGTGEVAEKMAVLGALQLYIDFVMIFRNLLYFMGERD